MMTTEVLCGIFDQFDVLERIAVDQQKVGERALLHHAEPAGIRVSRADRLRSSAFVDVAITSASAGVYQRVSAVSIAPCLSASAFENRTSVPNAVFILVLLRKRVDAVGAGNHLPHLLLLRRTKRSGAGQVEKGLRAEPDSLVRDQFRAGVVHEMTVLDKLDTGCDRALDCTGVKA